MTDEQKLMVLDMMIELGLKTSADTDTSRDRELLAHVTIDPIGDVYSETLFQWRASVDVKSIILLEVQAALLLRAGARTDSQRLLDLADVYAKLWAKQ